MTYNAITPSGLVGIQYDKPGDPGIICITDTGRDAMIDQVTIDNYQNCRVKLKASFPVFATKVPGSLAFSGYQHIKFGLGKHLLTMKQMRNLLDEIFIRYPERKEQFDIKMKETPKSSYDLPKTRMLVRIRANATRFERKIFTNNVLNFLKDNTAIVFDTVSFIEDLREKMVLLDLLNATIAVISFALGCFQLIVTI